MSETTAENIGKVFEPKPGTYTPPEPADPWKVSGSTAENIAKFFGVSSIDVPEAFGPMNQDAEEQKLPEPELDDEPEVLESELGEQPDLPAESPESSDSSDS